MSKKAFIFDMDGLLINSEPLWQQAGINILNQYGLTITHSDMALWTGLPTSTIVANACAKYHRTLDHTKAATDILNHAVELICDAKPLMPNVKETLTLLKEQGYRMAIASASPRRLLDHIVESCQIDDYFEYISSAHELPHSKPHPMVYLQACEQLGLRPEECVGVEDSKVGMTAVKAASMTAIVIPAAEHFTNAYWSLAEFKLASLAEITPEFLQKLG